MSSLKQLTLFQTVCELLYDGHGKGSEIPEGTLNELFLQRLSGGNEYNAVNPPWLSKDNTTVTIESWKTESLLRLVRKKEDQRPRYTNFPVVVVRYRGQDYLVDGVKRVSMWHTTGKDTDEHSAYIVTVHE